MDPHINAAYCPNCRQPDAVGPARQSNIAAPPKPSDTMLKVFRVFQWIWGGMFVLVALGVVGGTLLVGCTTLFAGSLDSSGTAALLAGPALLPILCIFPIALTLVGGLFVGAPWLIGRYLQRNYQARFAQWQRAYDKWGKLYYCQRCAGVFLPGQNRLVPLEQMNSFIYEVPPIKPQYPYSTF